MGQTESASVDPENPGTQWENADGSKPVGVDANLQSPLLQEEPSTKRKSVGRKILLSVALLLFIAGIVDHAEVSEYLQKLLDAVVGLGWVAAVVLGLVTAMLNLLMLPTFPLMIGAGVIFENMYGVRLGSCVGVVCIFGGLWCGSMGAFILGKTVFKGFAEKELNEYVWMKVINAMIQQEGWWVILLARMSPLLPAEVFNYACSVTSLTMSQYAAGCLGSLVPTSFWVISTAQATSLGKDSSKPDPLAKEKHVIVIALNVVVLVVLSALLYAAYRKYDAKLKATLDSDVLPDFGGYDVETKKSLRKIANPTFGMKRKSAHRTSSFQPSATGSF